MDAVVKLARTTGHRWLIACGADRNPEDLRTDSLWCDKSRHMFIEAPEEGISTCSSKRPNGELIEMTYDYVIASHSKQEKVNNMEVVEDVRVKATKRLPFLVERDTEIQGV